MRGTFRYVIDEKTGMGFKKFGSISALNLIPLDEIDAEMAPKMNDEFVCIGTHEQYFYSDYLAYQPDYPKCIYKMASNLKNNGYECFFIDELVK